MFPLTIPVLHERHIGDDEDELGNEVRIYAPPVEVMVFGLEPPKSSEPKLAGHERIVVDVEMYAPQSMGANPKDRVAVGGKKYDVVGEVEDPNINPWFQPGLVTINMHRIEG